MSIGINSNSTTHSTTHSHSHSYTKSNWSFYGYAPLDQVEIQNAGESTDTLITVLALNHYRRPAKADYRRSLSATNLLVTRDSPQSQSQPQLQQQQQQNTHTHAQPALPISASASFSSSNALAAALVSSTPTNQIQSYNAASSFEKPRDSFESPKNLLGREMALKKSMSSSQTSNSPIEMTVYKVTKLTSHNPHQNPQNLLSSSGSDLFSPISIPAYPPKSACNSTTNLSNPSTMINSSLSTSPVASISPSSNSATTTPASASIASSIVASTNPFPPPLRTFSLVLQHPTSVARRFFVNALLEAEKALSSSISASHYPASNSAMMYILASNDSSSKPSTNTDVIFPIITDSNTESDYDSQPHSNSNSHSESESQPHSRPQSTRSSFISPQQSTPTPTPTPTLQSQQQSQLHHLTVPIVSNLSSASSVLSSTSSTSNINSNHNTNLGNPEHSLSRSSSYGTTNDVFIMKPYSSSLYSSPSLPQSLNNNNTKDYIRTSSTQPSSSNTISPSDFNPNSSSLYNDHQN
ncbi:hypothetical protein AX774_g1512 [Zancudomyces culisetae]|uniref:Uncharacterized protein n=2 Tax=Zancudomyces culisetae TaxID=1213189 RepID=A0A1R1PVJ2_ZANCU|nr:hypothetical protein AX774_g1512 [Zancudomyces culisetae]|eukprot:OMH84961.1 hypothetical protein AX774_g1512 [Zancudomyces culisetae]